MDGHSSEILSIMRIASDIDRAVDEKDWPRLRRHFADRVAVDIGAVSGAELVEMTGDAFAAEIAALNPAGKKAYHCHTNPIVAIDGETATLESHSYGWVQCAALDPSLYEVWGFMDYRFRRSEGVWRVTHIRMVKLRDSGNIAVSLWRGPGKSDV